MRVIGISSSPREGGNSETLLDMALEGAMSKGAFTEKIAVNKLAFKPCQECGGCDKTGQCVLKDGLGAVYKKIDEADSLILASPIYFTSLSAQAKMMIDRFQCRWVAKYVLRRPFHGRNRRKGAFLCISGTGRRDFFLNAKQVVKAFFATIDVSYEYELYCGRLDEEHGILKKKWLLQKAFKIGQKLGYKIGRY